MGINQLSVVGPRSEQREQKTEKKDWVDRVLEGLQIAKGVTGITSDYQSIQNVKETRDQRDRIVNAKLKPGEANDEYYSKGFTKVAPGETPDLTYTDFDSGEQQGLRAPKRKDDLAIKIPDVKPFADGTTRQWNESTKQWDVLAREQPKAEQAPKDITVQERNTLQTQYDRDPEVRKTKTVLDSYASTQQLLKNPTPASDQALIYNYMKALDPNSVVRETEAETAAALGGLMERAKAQYTKLAGDGMLSDQQRADLAAQIRSLAESASARQATIDSDFTALASRRGVDAKDLRFVNRPLDEKTVSRDQKQNPGEAFAGPSENKVWVSNGKETLEIDAGDLDAAVKDGYKPMKSSRGASGGF